MPFAPRDLYWEHEGRPYFLARGNLILDQEKAALVKMGLMEECEGLHHPDTPQNPEWRFSHLSELAIG